MWDVLANPCYAEFMGEHRTPKRETLKDVLCICDLFLLSSRLACVWSCDVHVYVSVYAWIHTRRYNYIMCERCLQKCKLITEKG